MATDSATPIATPPPEESLTEAASRQMRELDLTKETSNGNSSAKKKSSAAMATPRSSSVSRATIKSPLRSPTTSSTGSFTDGEKIKLPMNKITVGNAPSPQITKATSKIGSLENTSYKPSGGKVKIDSKKLEWNAKSKIGSLGNLGHTPGGGGVKITTKKVEIKATSRIGSLDNTGYKPGGGAKKIFDDKDYMKRASRSSASSTFAGGKSSENLTTKSRATRSSSVSEKKLD